MKTIIYLIFLLFCGANLLAQDGFYIKILDDDVLPENIILKSDSTLNLKFKSSDLESIFDKYEIVKFEKYSKRTKNPNLINVYRIKTKDFAFLADELLEKYPEKFTGVEYWDEPVMLYDPNDFALETSDQNDMVLIRAKDAWEISKGNSNVIVGVNDTYIETTHEDLEDKIHSVLSNSSPHYHGVCVSFCAAGDTDNDTGLSSIGFNSSIMFKSGMSVSNLYDLADEGADIVNASWRYCSYSSYDADLIEDIHDMGVIITAGAGNGPARTSCGDGHDYCYPASYNHVLSVTSVAHLLPYGEIHPTYGAAMWEDCHEDSINNPNEVHTHNDSVDLCAPGYAVRTAKLNDSYGAAWGTSFAAPIVAGLCALILDENPNLDPDEVETILKSTAFDLTTIPENEEFDGLLGAGRINAYAALYAARELNVTYASLPYSTGFETGNELPRSRADEVSKHSKFHFEAELRGTNP